MKYSNTVDQLLHYGIFEYHYNWTKYLTLGFTLADVPALLQLATDKEIAQSEEQIVNSAPLHAWRILGLLKAPEACEPLLAEVIEQDDWSCEEPFKMLALIGEPALAPIDRYFSNPSVTSLNKIKVSDVFPEMMKHYPELREQCVAMLEKHLSLINEEYSDFAAFIIMALIDLNAKESIEIIRSAFQQDYVDTFIVGDIEAVEIDLGLREQKPTQKTNKAHIKVPTESTKQMSKSKPSQPVQIVKVGRNELCPCGSGKKYKKCCMS